MARSSPQGASDVTPTEYTLYPMRWLALFQFAVLNGGNAAQWIVFGIVVDQSKEFFGLETWQVNALPASFGISFIVLGPFAMTLFDKRGVRSGLRCASFFNFIGCILRFVAVLWAPNFTVLMISQIFLSVAFVFTFPAPPILAARWFGEKERTLATMIAATANSLGGAAGQLIPPLIVTPDNHGRDRWLILFAVGCSYALIEAVLIAFVIPFGPLTPPSSAEKVKGPGRPVAIEAAERRRSATASSSSDGSEETDENGGGPERLRAPLNAVEPGGATDPKHHTTTSSRTSASSCRSQVASQVLAHASVVEQLRALLSIPAFRGLLLGMALFFGGQWSCMSVMAQIVKPMGISEETVGWMGFSQIIAGALLAMPFSAWVDRIRVYKAPLTTMLCLCTLLYALYAMILTFQPPRMVPLAFAVYVLLGVPQACAIPVMFEYAVELTYPLDESLSGTAIVWLANVIGVPLDFLLPAMVGSPPSVVMARLALFLLAAITLIATAAVGIPKGHLKRLEFERVRDNLDDGDDIVDSHPRVAEAP